MLVRNRYLVALTCIAALPVVGAFAKAVANGWWPEGDDAMLALKVADVFSSHPPTMGMRATSGNADPLLAAHHPGPLAIYLLAIPAGLFGLHPVGLLLGMAAIHIGLIIGVSVVAHRRGGTRLTLIALAAVLLIEWAVGTEALFRPLNPFPASIGVLLLLLLTWSLVIGDTACTWGFVVVASLVGQANLAFMPLVALLTLTVCGAALQGRRRTSIARPGKIRFRIAGPRSRNSRRAVIAFVLSWLPVFVETVTYRHNNALQVTRFVLSDVEKNPLGWDQMARAFIPQLVPVPGGFSSANGLLVQGSSVMVFLGALILLVIAVLATPLVTKRWPSWRPEDRSAALVVLIALVTVGWSGASAPGSAVSVPWYWLLPVWPSVTFAWMVIVLAVLRTQIDGRAPESAQSWPSTNQSRAVSAVVLGLLAVVALQSPVVLTWKDEPGRQASAIVLEEVSAYALPPHPVQIRSGGGWTAWASLLPAVSYRLRAEGYPVYSVSHWPLSEDVTFRSADNAPAHAIQIHLLERASDGGWVGKTDGPGWRRIGAIPGKPAAGQSEVEIFMRTAGG